MLNLADYRELALAGGATEAELAEYERLHQHLFSCWCRGAQARVDRQDAERAAAAQAQRERVDAVARTNRGTAGDIALWQTGIGMRGVYVIRHIPSGREYIGQSAHIRSRLGQHFTRLRSGWQAAGRLYCSEEYRRDGEAALEWAVLERLPDDATKDDLLTAEARHISDRDPYYNRPLRLIDRQTATDGEDGASA